MTKIRILTPDIYNKISAGEVIENPASALKELVENSIDAGANYINIEIEGGGLKRIVVTDNGYGIDKDDIATAFIKHATSKLEFADDLCAVQTMGFRGEALASIAAVSRVKLTSRTPSCDTAVTVQTENGEVVSQMETSANTGTTIEVTDLFYNTPVRMKFLKSPAHETTEITKYVAKLILTSSYLTVNYSCDGKIIYKTNGGGLEEAIYAVYGADCLKNCLRVNYEYRNMRLVGYIGSPEYTKANSTYQTLSVNGRPIVDKNISTAIMLAFKPYLMTRKYPFYVLNLDIPFDEVDVNVHPRKAEVRFEDPKKVFNAFLRCIKETLEGYTQAKVDSILSSSNDNVNDEETTTPIDIVNSSNDKAKKITDFFNDYESFQNAETMTKDQAETIIAIDNATVDVLRRKEFEEFADRMERNVTIEGTRKSRGMEEAPANQRHRSKKGEATIVNERPADVVQENMFIDDDNVDEDDAFMNSVRILGAAFKTYLILEKDDKLVFVDQHAAHERILFDKIMASHKNIMQQLAVPYVFTVKDDEALFIKSNIQNISDAGIQVEEFGTNTFRITGISTLLQEMKMERFVDYMLTSMEEYAIDDRKLIVERIATKACKAAVKAGESLTEIDIKYILQCVCNDKVLQCPHGRPITVVFTKTQFEKMFKRIV